MSDLYLEFTDKPRHKHWDMFDMSQEGCRFNYLETLTSSVNFSDKNAQLVVTDICRLVQSKAYADEDSFLNYLSKQNEDETTEYSKAMMEQHDEDPDAEYTIALYRSIALLAETAVTESARKLVSNLDARFTQARNDGVFLYLDKQNEEIEANDKTSFKI